MASNSTYLLSHSSVCQTLGWLDWFLHSGFPEAEMKVVALIIQADKGA